jgi:hypothetical protein
MAPRDLNSRRPIRWVRGIGLSKDVKVVGLPVRGVRFLVGAGWLGFTGFDTVCSVTEKVIPSVKSCREGELLSPLQRVELKPQTPFVHRHSR